MKRKKKAWIALFLLLTVLTGSGENTAAKEAEKAVSAGRLETAFGEGEEVEISSRFWELFFGKSDKTEEETEPKKEENEVLKLCPGGDVLGVAIRGCGVTVVNTKSEDSPFCAGDRIRAVNGIGVTESAQVRKCIEESGGKAVRFTVLRGEKEIEFEVIPTENDGNCQVGIALSDSAAGIGTLTYVNPGNGCFGCLGHAIAGGDSDAPLPMSNGLTTDALLGGVKRGKSGSPGELRGVLGEEVTGKIRLNTVCGVFGRFTDAETQIFAERETVEILPKSEVKEGGAVIRSTLKNGMLGEYAVEIYEIDRSSEETKSFRVRVTDPDLIAITGGIVRGMSGSPILQDGKLVGAVTHVTVGDPTEGYGIFIENMLSASGKIAETEMPNAA